MELYERLKKLYDAYVDTFREPDGKLPPMMQLKYVHTMMVVKNAQLIAEGEGFSAKERSASVAAALLHDTGRYEQLRRYNTFKDSDSVDHAVFSHDIVKSLGWLEDSVRLSDCSDCSIDGPGEHGNNQTIKQSFNRTILDAVLYHNRRDLPEGMDPLTAVAARTVRDSDKLDIFRVLEDQVAHSDWRHDSRAFWNLQVGVPPNPEVVEAIRGKRPVDYQQIKSLADFVLIQVGWMYSGLEFATSRRLCRERGHLAYRRKFLAEIGGGSSAEELCDLVKTAVV